MTHEEVKKRIKEIRIELFEILDKVEGDGYEADQICRAIENGITNLRIKY